jgi:hypothetical protein
LRFLARAYTCCLEDLEAAQMPKELSDIVGSDTSRSVVLVQMVYAMQSEPPGALADNPEISALVSQVHGPSVHRLNAIVPFGDSEFRLYPVVFCQSSKRQI